jgi:hypothetical protein
MFDFLGRGKNKPENLVDDNVPSTAAPTKQISATQREMVRMVLHSVLKQQGIPGSWIGGEVVPVRAPGQADALLLQLEIKHWHDALVLHAPALQAELLAGLKRFDTQANHTGYLFSWKFSADCACPHTVLPEPAFWKTSKPSGEQSAIAAEGVKPTTAKAPFDLPPRAIHSKEDDDNGFAATQMRDIQ